MKQTEEGRLGASKILLWCSPKPPPWSTQGICVLRRIASNAPASCPLPSPQPWRFQSSVSFGGC